MRRIELIAMSDDETVLIAGHGELANKADVEQVTVGRVQDLRIDEAGGRDVPALEQDPAPRAPCPPRPTRKQHNQ